MSEEPDWDKFETYKGPEEKPMPAWLGVVIHWVMVVVVLPLIFAVGAAVAFFAPYQFRRGAERMLEESMASVITRCVIGGCVTVGAALVIYFRKRDDVI